MLYITATRKDLPPIVGTRKEPAEAAALAAALCRREEVEAVTIEGGAPADVLATLHTLD